MDWFFGTIIGLLVLGLVVILAMLPFIIHSENQFKAECQAKGGKILYTKSRLYCMKPDAFIDINTN